MLVIGRFADSKDPVLFARFGEVDKCEFIKTNAPEEAWTSTDDGAGVLVKADGLREHAREMLVSAARHRTSPLPQLSLASAISTPACCGLTTVAETRRHTAFGTIPAAAGPWLTHSNRCAFLAHSGPAPPARTSQGQGVRLATKKEPVAAVKKKTAQASCSPPPAQHILYSFLFTRHLALTPRQRPCDSPAPPTFLVPP